MTEPPAVPKHPVPLSHRLILMLALVLSVIAIARTFTIGTAPSGSGGWLTGSVQEKFDEVAGQFGGFDRAMWEVAHRTRELIWAGNQQDWNYAAYQLEEMRETLEDAIVRRPDRAANTQLFFQEGLDPLAVAIQEDPAGTFAPALQQFVAACVNCHAREDAPIVDLNAWIATGALPAR